MATAIIEAIGAAIAALIALVGEAAAATGLITFDVIGVVAESSLEGVSLVVESGVDAALLGGHIILDWSITAAGYTAIAFVASSIILGISFGIVLGATGNTSARDSARLVTWGKEILAKRTFCPLIDRCKRPLAEYGSIHKVDHDMRKRGLGGSDRRMLSDECCRPKIRPRQHLLRRPRQSRPSGKVGKRPRTMRSTRQKRVKVLR